jgi:hypothetical protein
MKPCTILLVSSLVGLSPIPSFAQDRSSWGETFTCSVNWFVACATTSLEPAADSEKPNDKAVRTINNLPFSQQRSNLPEPVQNVLENPSPESAKAYVTWSRQAKEKLTKATEYIAQATRELNEEGAPRDVTEKNNAISASGLGPVGLYYFFSPSDQTALKDIRVLNRIYQEGRLGVVGIPVRAKDEEIVQFVNETKPLFPVRRSDAEVRMVKPSETPELYLALPLEKKMFRLGSTITESAITEAIGSIVAARTAPAP